MRKRRRKTAPEERAGARAYGEDLDRRLRAKIEELRSRSSESSGASTLVDGDLDQRLRRMIDRYRRLSMEGRSAGGATS